MNPWYAKAAVLVNMIGYSIIRWPHGNRSQKVRVVHDRRGPREIALLVLATIGVVVLPIVWLTTRVLAFADHPLQPAPYVLGAVLIVFGLWLFHRAHADLGENWSVTLQVRENHRLVTTGVYERIRHPMYSAMFLLAIGQALTLPNWIAGPAYLLGFGFLYFMRVDAEERMMHDLFGREYEEYMRRSGRLIPLVR